MVYKIDKYSFAAKNYMNIKMNALVWIFLIAGSSVQAMVPRICVICEMRKAGYLRGEDRAALLLAPREVGVSASFDPEALAMQQLEAAFGAYYSEDIVAYVVKKDRRAYDVASLGRLFENSMVAWSHASQMNLCKALLCGSFSEQRIAVLRDAMEKKWHRKNPEIS